MYSKIPPLEDEEDDIPILLAWSVVKDEVVALLQRHIHTEERQNLRYIMMEQLRYQTYPPKIALAFGSLLWLDESYRHQYQHISQSTGHFIDILNETDHSDISATLQFGAGQFLQAAPSANYGFLLRRFLPNPPGDKPPNKYWDYRAKEKNHRNSVIAMFKEELDSAMGDPSTAMRSSTEHAST